MLRDLHYKHPPRQGVLRHPSIYFQHGTTQSTLCTFQPHATLTQSTQQMCPRKPRDKRDREKHCQKSSEESCFIPSQVTQRNQGTEDFVANLWQHVGMHGLGVLSPALQEVILSPVPTCLYTHGVKTPEDWDSRKNCQFISNQGATQNS